LENLKPSEEGKDFRDLTDSACLIGKKRGAAVEAPGGDKIFKIAQVNWLEQSPQKRKR
jgi:hypothetical protein